MIKLSVIICTYNRDDHLKKTLDSLLNQSVNKNTYEVIIIDNNSKDKTAVISKEYIKNHSQIDLKYFLETNQGLSFARNRGIKEAGNEIISFIDDDAVATKNYVDSLLREFGNSDEIKAVGGKVIPVYPKNKEPEWMSKYLWSIVAKVDQGDSEHEFKKKYPVGCNMAFRKEVFTEHGLFNVDIKYRGDEKFLFLKLKKKKELIYYNPNVVVYHSIPENRLTYESFVKNCVNVGESEKIRMEDHSLFGRILKLAEYIFKLGASLLIGIIFIIKGQSKKASYLTQAMFYILVGLLRGKN